MKLYTKAFYSKRHKLTLTSAAIILEHIFNTLNPKSAIDFGCGTGIWLKECVNCGVDTVLGIDGDWIDGSDLEISSSDIVYHDLEKIAYVPARKYDFAICIEVAEHLSASMGNKLITSLVAASDVVLFSAAVVGQGGTGHINERPQSYWAEKFFDNDFFCIDLIRPFVWDNNNVNVIYKQNMLLYVKEEKLKYPFGSCLPIWSSYDINRIHPDLLKIKAARGSAGLFRSRLHRIMKYLRTIR